MKVFFGKVPKLHGFLFFQKTGYSYILFDQSMNGGAKRDNNEKNRGSELQ
jgi:hypothetical protein